MFARATRVFALLGPVVALVLSFVLAACGSSKSDAADDEAMGGADSTATAGKNGVSSHAGSAGASEIGQAGAEGTEGGAPGQGGGGLGGESAGKGGTGEPGGSGGAAAGGLGGGAGGGLSGAGGAGVGGGGGSGAGGSGAGGSGGSGGTANNGGSSMGGTGPVDTVVWQWGQPDHEGPLASAPWVVDNTLGKFEGDSAVHPPALKADATSDFTLNCGGAAHSQLSFRVYRPGGGSLTLLVDGVERQAITAYNNQWSYYVFEVADKTHTYTFRASSATDVASSFALDSLKCREVAPQVNADQKVDFDQSYVPPETSGWYVDNALGVHPDGTDSGYESAAHPPALKADKPVDMTFNCGEAAHTQLTFQVYRPGGGTLTLLVDGVERQAITAYNNQWSYYVFEVPQKAHTYTFRASSASDVGSSFVVDTLRCRNIAPIVNPDQRVDFDQSYVPPETSGWYVDNALGVHPDGTDSGYESAIHPPALKADKPVDMTFSCGGVAHKELDFNLYRPGGGTLTLLVDGVERQALTGFNNQWSAYQISSASGPHVYTFRAFSATDVATSFVLDTFVCKP